MENTDTKSINGQSTNIIRRCEFSYRSSLDLFLAYTQFIISKSASVSIPPIQYLIIQIAIVSQIIIVYTYLSMWGG